MAVIRVVRPKRDWSLAPATVLPAGVVFRLLRVHWNFTVLLDGRPAGEIGVEQVKDFEVQQGEHRLQMRFLLLRRSKELRASLQEGETRLFVCSSNGIGWPTLREASPEDVAEVQGSSLSR
jgi:hypothetical protein